MYCALLLLRKQPYVECAMENVLLVSFVVFSYLPNPMCFSLQVPVSSTSCHLSFLPLFTHQMATRMFRFLVATVLFQLVVWAAAGSVCKVHLLLRELLSHRAERIVWTVLFQFVVWTATGLSDHTGCVRKVHLLLFSHRVERRLVSCVVLAGVALR